MSRTASATPGEELWCPARLIPVAVVGDALVGHNGVLRYGAEPRPELVRALIESRVERILVSHGEPVLGGEALRALLAV